MYCVNNRYCNLFLIILSFLLLLFYLKVDTLTFHISGFLSVVLTAYFGEVLNGIEAVLSSSLVQLIGEGNFSFLTIIYTLPTCLALSLFFCFQKHHYKFVQNKRNNEFLQSKNEVNNLYSALINNNFYPVLIVNLNGDIINLSPAAANILGISRVRLADSLYNYLDGKSYQNIMAVLQKKQVFHDEVLLKTGEEERYAELFLAHLKDDLYIGNITDITERKKMEKIKDEFISVVSHELRSPLAMMRASTDLLYSSVEDKLFDLQLQENENNLGLSMQRDLNRISSINSYIDQLSSIITHLLDITRFDLGKINLKMQRLSLMELLSSIVDDMSMINGEHVIYLCKEEGEGELYVNVDPSRVRDVINNLISNAVKYSPAGTTITVSLQKKGKKAVVSVKDEGIGIPAQEKDLIFQRFYMIQNNGRPWAPKKGLGLGLYICRRLIELHGGEIWCESEEGKGSTFYFSLPL